MGVRYCSLFHQVFSSFPYARQSIELRVLFSIYAELVCKLASLQVSVLLHHLTKEPEVREFSEIGSTWISPSSLMESGGAVPIFFFFFLSCFFFSISNSKWISSYCQANCLLVLVAYLTDAQC